MHYSPPDPLSGQKNSYIDSILTPSSIFILHNSSTPMIVPYIIPYIHFTLFPTRLFRFSPLSTHFSEVPSMHYSPPDPLSGQKNSYIDSILTPSSIFILHNSSTPMIVPYIIPYIHFTLFPTRLFRFSPLSTHFSEVPSMHYSPPDPLSGQKNSYIDSILTPSSIFILHNSSTPMIVPYIIPYIHFTLFPTRLFRFSPLSTHFSEVPSMHYSPPDPLSGQKNSYIDSILTPSSIFILHNSSTPMIVPYIIPYIHFTLFPTRLFRFSPLSTHFSEVPSMHYSPPDPLSGQKNSYIDSILTPSSIFILHNSSTPMIVPYIIPYIHFTLFPTRLFRFSPLSTHFSEVPMPYIGPTNPLSHIKISYIDLILTPNSTFVIFVNISI